MKESRTLILLYLLVVVLILNTIVSVLLVLNFQSAPGIEFVEDSDTGFYWPNPYEVCFAINGETEWCRPFYNQTQADVSK